MFNPEFGSLTDLSSVNVNSNGVAALQSPLLENGISASSDPAITPPSSGKGLLGQYYDSKFNRLKLTRTDAAIDFNWGGGSPDSTVPIDQFSVRWTGKIQPAYSETYTFYTLSDDGVRLWINGQQIINNWTDHPPIEDSNAITLIAGQKYDIRLEYYEGTGGAISKLSWSSPNQPKETIPQARLYEPDLTLPTADLTAPDVFNSGGTSYRFTVTYKDTQAIKLATIDRQDILVSGPNRFSQPAQLVSVSGGGGLVTATYSIDVPGGAWDAIDTGSYTVVLQANQVSDTDNNFIPAGTLGTFRVDLAPPTATFRGTTAIVGGTDYRFTIVYSDDTAVSRRTIDNPNIVISGPNNFRQIAQFNSVNSDRDGRSLTVLYGTNAPGGIWDSADTGTYTITLQPNQVSDANSNFMPAEVLGSFQVDLTPPTATLSATPITEGSSRYTFSVVYRDEKGVSRSTIDNQDILVNGPKNFSQLAKLVSTTLEPGRPLIATYSIDAPDGVWKSTDAGTYSLALQANQISDLNSNFTSAGVLGTLQVDFVAPTAQLAVLTPVIRGSNRYRFEVTYQDDVAVGRSTIDNQDILVNGPKNFSQLAKLVSVKGDGDRTVLATYEIEATGAWDSADTGDYRITLQANQVSDLSGNFAPTSLLNTLRVSLPGDDFNGDGKADVLWYNPDTRNVELWLINGVEPPGTKIVGTNNASIEQIGDFNGDGKSDLVWRKKTGEVEIWFLDGFSSIEKVTLPYLVPADWSSTIGDLNGDGKSDLFWRKDTGEVGIWLFDGALPTATMFPYIVPADWTQTPGDFNGDGKTDLFWRKDTGEVGIWLMEGAKVPTATMLTYIVPSDWSLAVGDFNGDGKHDLLWRKDTGEVGIWLMEGANLSNVTILPFLISSNFSAIVSDFNGDIKTDVLWYNSLTREVRLWLIDNTQIVNTASYTRMMDSAIANLTAFD
ncbi:PA14 domain-containing protein [Phormidesmis sp. 146-35]